MPDMARPIVAANGWDPHVFDRLQASPKFSAPGTADHEFRREQLVEVSRLIPKEILLSGAAVGTAAECAARLRLFLDAGADELLLHGATPDLCGPLVQEFRALMQA
jgi:alkanesulfonate monooxygenase SsuD/methylene tetrahydromethanopterin reductase-like flavin-dependent oxidoreductase (luciferase family)